MPVQAYRAISFLTLLSACQDPTAPSPARKEEAPVATPIEDKRSQYDFAKEWATIDKIEDEEERTTLGLALAPQWEGRVYQWYGYFMPGLCYPEREACFAQIFDRKKTDSPDSLGGFMPTINFTKEGYADLRAGCQGKQACIVYFRGTLSEARTDAFAPLAFTFTETSVEKTRDVLPEEQWWRGPITLPASATLRKPRVDPRDQGKIIDLSALIKTKKDF